jgi:hypothetical protein
VIEVSTELKDIVFYVKITCTISLFLYYFAVTCYSLIGSA